MQLRGARIWINDLPITTRLALTTEPQPPQQLNSPWSQWTPYFPLWHVSQAVPSKPLLHWHTPVPLVPSTHSPLPKQGWPLGPGHGSQCCPKNPPQHLRTWRRNRLLTLSSSSSVWLLTWRVTYDGLLQAGRFAADRQQTFSFKHPSEHTLPPLHGFLQTEVKAL